MPDFAPLPDPGVPPDEQRSLKRWWPFGAAFATLLVVLWAFVTAWSGIWGSHPAYLITLLAVAIGAVGLALWALLTSRSEQRSKRWVWISRAGLMIGTAAMIGVVIYLRPLSASQVSIDAMSDGHSVDVTESSSTIRLDPIDGDKSSGLVFYPGAKVDPRAYVRILRPIAEAGYPVVITKPPYNLAILDSHAANDFIGDTNDTVENWVVGGHSLGGAMAARYAESDRDELAGMLLYAAYPVNDMSARTDLAVTLVSGTNDEVINRDRLADAVDELPPSAQFVPIDGGIHAFFGDYGSQRGDGTPTIDRDDAQRQIAAASIAFLDSIENS